MRKIIFIFIFFLSSCGYQPIYLNKNLKDVEFNKITIEGDTEINKKILNSISLKEDKSNNSLNNLIIQSSYNIEETSKNSKGQVDSYKSKLVVTLIIKNKEDSISDKSFLKEFSYNSKDNKFELDQYQNEIKNNLINKIIEDIVLYLSI